MLVNEKSKGSSKARGFEVFYSSFPNLGKKIKLLFVGFFFPLEIRSIEYFKQIWKF